ncbi:hypothetical protein CSM99_004359 [Salmonella enterica subsp. diarizonae]|nr:hypothetical protein [Salmonella enterica subsp. diarizonae]
MKNTIKNSCFPYVFTGGELSASCPASSSGGLWKYQWVSHSTDLYRASYYQPANMQAAHHVSDFLFFPGNKVPELYFNLSKFFSRGLLSPVHAAYLPALRVIPAISCNFADFCNFTGEVFFNPYDFL